MADPLKKVLKPIPNLQNIRGVDLPIGLEFLQLVVTGPPGAGKSYYIEQIGGWPNEGYIDLSSKGWWKNQSLVFRPREVHLGLPFIGHREALTVFDKEWLESGGALELDFKRIRIPPQKTNIFQTNWRERYIFEFLIPPPSVIYKRRQARGEQGYFPVDEGMTIDLVRNQVAVYRQVAFYLHRAGLNVYLRRNLNRPPMYFAEGGLASVPHWTLDPKPRRPSLKTLDGWKFLLRRRYPIDWLHPTETAQEIVKPVRIAHDGRSFALDLNGFKLRIQPELAYGSKRQVDSKSWIVNTEQGCSTKSIAGFARIQQWDTVVIGKGNTTYDQMFHFPDGVANRHLSIYNRRGDLILTPLSPEYPTRIFRLDDADHRERIERGRLKALREVRDLFGGSIHPLPSRQALTTLQAVNRLLGQEPNRPLNSDGEPGGMVQIEDNLTPVIVGDLHGQVDHFLKILSENCLLSCLKLKNACLIILGDAVHSEHVDELEKFDSSMQLMDLIFQLKLRFPANVYYLRGNHDSFDPDINKNGVLQGVLFRQELERARGTAYVAAMEEFYRRLPYAVFSQTLIACHAGPPHKQISTQELIDINRHPELADELTRSRIQRPNSTTIGYGKRDVKRFRESLGLTAKARLIVGHTPMDPFGSFWLHAGAIKNHHIIYSAHNQGPSIIIRTGDNYFPISFPAEPLTKIINSLNERTKKPGS